MVLLITFCVCTSNADEVVHLNKRGALAIDNLVFFVCFSNKIKNRWVNYFQTSPYQKRIFKLSARSAKNAETVLNIPDFPVGDMKTALTKQENGSWLYNTQIKFKEAVKLRSIVLKTIYNADYAGQKILIDGKAVILPLKYKKTHFFSTRNVSKIVFPSKNGTIEITGQKLGISMQDNRAWKNGNSFSIRISFNPSWGTLSRSQLKLYVSHHSTSSTPLDLKAAVNMSFADNKSGDGKGGWTDQGATNDLRMLPVGRKRLNGIDFEIINPRKNNGKSCIVLGASARPYLPMKAGCKLPRQISGKYLYLLHATAWGHKKSQLGTINLTYTDGTHDAIKVMRTDVGNWWNPVPRDRGEVAWIGENKSSYVGLYRSCYPIQNKPIKRIDFESTGSAVWGIVAASVSNYNVPMKKSIPYYIVAGKNWKPIDYERDVKPGSILDFSNRLDAPAGKYGPVIIRNGKMVFSKRPNKALRFYGTNLVSYAPNYPPTKQWAERLADRIASYGFNAIRFHHHDGGMVDRRKTTELSPDDIDRMDYLFHCFKKRGIYITTDLYVSRRLPAGEIPEYKGGRMSNISVYKALVWILDSAFENWKTYSRNYLNHVNPYTGLAVKNDPALISIALVNEGNITSCWNATPFTAKLYNDRFALWLKQNKFSFKNTAERNILFSRFLYEIYCKRFAQMKKFLHELGVKYIVSDQNMGTSPFLSVMRSKYDYVDNHGYFSHPGFPVNSWRLPSIHRQDSVLQRRLPLPGQLFASRLFDKPFAVTEFDYAKPNRYRAEGPAVMAAYASLQAWDALFQFAYSHGENYIKKGKTSNNFDLSTDVIKHYAHRLAANMFLSRTIKPAPVAYSIVIDSIDGIEYSSHFPKEITPLGLIGRVGGIVVKDAKNLKSELPKGIKALINTGFNFPATDSSLPVLNANAKDLIQEAINAKVLNPELYDAKKEVFLAANKQIRLDAKQKMFKVIAPACEVLVMPAGKKDRASFMEIENKTGRGVFAVLAHDNKNLKKSNRILLLHLTNALPNKMKFASKDMNRLESWGNTPFLAERGKAKVIFHPESGTDYSLFAVNSTGKRIKNIPLQKNNGKFTATLNVFLKKDSVFAYELVKK